MTNNLPALPLCWTGSPVTVTWAEDGETTTREVYTADQMRAYALAAIAGQGEGCSDSQMLDALQAFIDEHGGIRLHNGDYAGNFGGLGLLNTGRTLRQALSHLVTAVPLPRKEGEV